MSDCDAPAGLARRIAGRSLFLMFDFVADDAADGGTADGSEYATTGKDGAADGADTRADGGVLVLRRHSGTRTQAEQHGCGNGTECGPLKRINGVEVAHNRSLK
jgi:hypothetical protein